MTAEALAYPDEAPVDIQPARTSRERALGAIRSEAERRGLTQEQLAEMVGRPQSYVSRVMTGTKRLNLDDIDRFAEAYECTAADLVGGVLTPHERPHERRFMWPFNRAERGITRLPVVWADEDEDTAHDEEDDEHPLATVTRLPLAVTHLGAVHLGDTGARGA